VLKVPTEIKPREARRSQKDPIQNPKKSTTALAINKQDTKDNTTPPTPLSSSSSSPQFKVYLRLASDFANFINGIQKRLRKTSPNNLHRRYGFRNTGGTS
jgi:hypothetical protein